MASCLGCRASEKHLVPQPFLGISQIQFPSNYNYDYLLYLSVYINIYVDTCVQMLRAFEGH